jgi:hypothetical protein
MSTINQDLFINKHIDSPCSRLQKNQVFVVLTIVHHESRHDNLTMRILRLIKITIITHVNNKLSWI